jgi:RecJ-like exonuclease
MISHLSQVRDQFEHVSAVALVGADVNGQREEKYLQPFPGFGIYR